MCRRRLMDSIIDRNLMAPDDFKNLGLIFDKQEGANGANNATSSEGAGTKS